ncbi:MAG: hypothetical protein JKY48_13470 [Flavobacteriales bacterium]|nr:hypothetical protein [Flavobacteriales bacterium]
MKLKITNDRTADADKMYLLLTATSQTGLTGIAENTSVKLSDFITSNPSMTITADSIVGARLYVGYGAFPTDNDPVPGGPQYYGWIEFTQNPSESNVWINLSNVDLSGLPLTLAGTDISNAAFSLGYKKSVSDIVTQMVSDAFADPKSDANPAYITCTTGQVKILGPNKTPASYPSYSDYISALSTNAAPLSITTDTPKGAPAITLTGSFLNAINDSDPIISLKTADGANTLVVLKSQFNTTLIYECGGGKLIFNGNTVDQNQSPQNTNDKLYANSAFRNILIGMNEGYFTKTGPNNSEGFGGQVPFATGDGSKYAQVLHENSNSYGFPYADSNLKVLVQANSSDTIDMTICTDTEAKGYSDDKNTPNMPTSGDYQFGIGGKSSDLGMITIGNWRYIADKTTGGYGGYLPTLTEWTKMEFAGPGKYIWIKTTGAGLVSADKCFNTGAPTYINKVLTWGASVSWVSGVDSPAKPTS